MDATALKRARELRGLSANALAAKIDVSQAIIWKIEAGQIRASIDLTNRIAKALDVPVEFLVRTPRLVSEGSVGLFRAHSSKVNKTEATSIRQTASVLFEFVDRLADGVQRPPPSIPRSFGEAPELVATRARALLGYTSEEPISNLTRRLEKLGVTIVKSNLIEDAIFGYSTWANEKVPRPFIILSHYQTPYRMRWTLAHELAHIMLGHEYAPLPPGRADEEADNFAAALLVPPEQFAEDILAGTTLSALSYLKTKYGVSLVALARRAHEIGMIDSNKYTSLNVQISQKGWRKKEPGDDSAQYEEPSLVKELIEAKYAKSIIGDDIAADLGLPYDVVFPAMLSTRGYQMATNVRNLLV